MENKMEKKTYVKEYIIDNSYFTWLKEFLEERKSFSYKRENYVPLSDNDYIMFDITKKLDLLLAEYAFKNNIKLKSAVMFYVKYKEGIYCFSFINHKINVELAKDNSIISSDEIIDYTDFRKFCRKNMEDNFDRLVDDIRYSLNNTDREKIKYELSHIDGPTLVSGVGGSSVVSMFASKVLEKKNRIITRHTEPRDFVYMDLSNYSNVLTCSYSGNNYGVDVSFDNNLNHYLLSSQAKDGDIKNLTYLVPSIEKSFTNISSTLVPCTILLDYYLGKKSVDLDSFKWEYDFDTRCSSDLFEIFSGYDSIVPSTYLETTIVEAGLGTPIVHDKYSYCHGRMSLTDNFNSTVIYFDGGKDLDKLILSELKKSGKEIIIIKCSNSLTGEYKALIESMYLARYIAKCKNKDLSGVDFAPSVRTLYKFSGKM